MGISAGGISKPDDDARRAGVTPTPPLAMPRQHDEAPSLADAVCDLIKLIFHGTRGGEADRLMRRRWR